MSNYYTKRDSKVRLAEELSNRGWKIFGYKENESDSMTDYYSPANWSCGIATKNGYTIVIDDKYASYSNKEITVYNKDYKYMSNSDTNKIEALKNMTQEKGATEGEENNAKSLIEKLEAKYENQTTSQYEVVDVYPTYMGNSKGSIWHIEKDGALVDKGNALTIFADVPESYMFDISTMEYKESYKKCRSYNYDLGCEEWTKRELTESELKAIKALKSFILRVERAVSGCNTCGDGTTETEKAGLEQQENETMEKVIEKVKKNVIKLELVERENSLKVGDIFWQNGSGYMKVTEANEDCAIYRTIKLGRESRGFQESKASGSRINWNMKSINRAVNNKSLKVYVLVEVEEVTEKETWVKVKAKNTYKGKTTPTTKEEVKTETQENNTNSEEVQEVKVVLNENKNGAEIYFNEKPSQEVRTEMKANGFRWGGIKNNCWYAKQSDNTLKFAYELELRLNKIDLTESTTAEDKDILNCSVVQAESQIETTTDPYNQDKIEQGYIYSCHFKSWDMTIEQIKNELLALGIRENNLIDYGNKIGIENVNCNLMTVIKIINNKNGSILFIDSKIKIDSVADKEEFLKAM